MAEKVDVVIVGAGPVGLTLANILGLQGVRTLVVDERDSLIDYPRGVGLDDEALRTFQGIGLVDQILPHTVPNQILRFFDAKRTTARRDGTTRTPASDGPSAMASSSPWSTPNCSPASTDSTTSKCGGAIRWRTAPKPRTVSRSSSRMVTNPSAPVMSSAATAAAAQPGD